MVKLNKILILIILLLLLFLSTSYGRNDDFCVILVSSNKIGSNVLGAYKSVLEEEGVPFKIMDPYELLSLSPKIIAQNYPAIIFPDGECQILPRDAKLFIEEFVNWGGNVAIIYDAGIKDKRGNFLEEPLFSDIVGINYCPYNTFKDSVYTYGFLYFMDELEVPPGKKKDGKLLSGYFYGPLIYPLANVIQKDSNYNIYGYAMPGRNNKIPIVVLKSSKNNSKILYVNLPLGYLKAYSDDLPLRLILRFYLFKVLKIPHLQNTFFAKGGLVINWHVDSSIEWKNIPILVNENYFSKYIPYSIHITAGDFRDVPGDNLGFDAEGKGRNFVSILKDFGEIGCHGGWAHNYFSDGLIKNKFSYEQIKDFIKRNKDALEKIVNYKIREYSAPNGVHPQPTTTKILEELGFNSYYYTGDSGSSPNRTFFNEKMVSDKVLAFPILPYENSASFYEMKKKKVSEEKVEKWLLGIVDYVERNRVIRLIYSHPYDILSTYPRAVKLLNTRLIKDIGESKVLVKSMGFFADFILRFLKTTYRFSFENDSLNVKLSNPIDLYGISIAIPKERFTFDLKNPNLLVDKDDDWYYIIINKKIKSIELSFRRL
ncbi:MAG: hypothetical protein CBR30_07330 [Dictyoglomus sp. NZ13-RE01]|nr:MAG: hypothetical protein CBR30_07330 [Dictyoglomus sp. NZ13-RE01]